MQKTANTVIIGGGMIGCAMAYELALRGMKDIVVVEKEYLCSGATGRCGAGVRQQWGTETNAILARDSVKRFEQMNEELEYDKDIEFKQGGYLLCAYTEAEWTQFHKNVELQKRLGIPVELVNVLEEVTLKKYPELNQIKAVLNEAGLKSLMSGSGPTVFGIADTYEKAIRTAETIKNKWETVLIAHTM